MPTSTKRTSSAAVGAALVALVLLALAAAAQPSLASDAAPQPDDGLLAIRDLLGDPSFEDVFSRSFECILADSQHVEYAAEDDFGRFLYRKRFWTRCDPTPATDVNEFLEEHLRRLAYSLAHFCPDGNMDWDQRGDVALRFGLPTHRLTIGGDIGLAGGGMGIDPPAEEWSYNREDMTVRFIDPNLDERYQTGYDIKHLTYSGRPEVQVDSRDPTSGPYDPPWVPVPIELMHAMAKQKSRQDRGQRALDDITLSYGHSPLNAPIPFYYEVVTARGRDGRTDLAVNYQVPRSELTYEPDGERQSAVLAKRLRVMNEDYDVLASQARTLTVRTERGADVAEDDLLMDEWRFNMEPGVYILGFAVEDTLSKRAGYGRSLVTVPDYHRAGLSMSDIQLSTGVGPGNRFLRMGGAVMPNPVHAFRQDEEMVIYFELYGLTEDVPDIGRFTVTTEITAGQFRPEEGWIKRFFARLIPERPLSISTRVIGTGPVPDTSYWFSLALSTLKEDNYNLEITVKDVRAGTEVSKTTAFTVLED